MSAIQWISYSNGNGYLLKVLLNEKEVALTVTTITYPYYKWDDVKSYYSNALQSIGTNLQAGMSWYLMDLK